MTARPARLCAGLLPALWLLSTGAHAWAHAQYKPFSLNRYLLASCQDRGLSLDYTITIGDVPATELKRRADDDGDGRLGQQEANRLVEWIRGQVERGLRLAIDGRPQALSFTTQLELGEARVRVYAPIRLRLTAVLELAPGSHTLLLHDTSRLPALEQSEFLLAGGDRCTGSKIFVTGSARPVSGPIFWNQGRPPEPLQIRLRVQPEGESAAQPAGSAGGQRGKLLDDTGPLKRALADKGQDAWGFLLMLLVAVGLGAAHALSPGHGKTLVAAYLVGSRGQTRHALVLGLVVTITHVASVVALGLVALWASQAVAAERLAPYLSLAAGLLVIATGAWMLADRWRHLGHAHHEHAHDDHHHHHHGWHRHHHHAPSAAKAGKPPGNGAPRWGELLLLGLSGGLVPCPAATVVLLFAVYLGRIGRGLLLIGAFSLGLALTLILLGLLVVRGGSLLGRLLGDRSLARLGRWLPLASAAVVLLVGAVMTVLAAVAL